MTGLNTQRIPINHREICTYIYIYMYHGKTSHYKSEFERDFSILIVACHQLLQTTASLYQTRLLICISLYVYLVSLNELSKPPVC